MIQPPPLSPPTPSRRLPNPAALLTVYVKAASTVERNVNRAVITVIVLTKIIIVINLRQNVCRYIEERCQFLKNPLYGVEESAKLSFISEELKNDDDNYGENFFVNCTETYTIEVQMQMIL